MTEKNWKMIQHRALERVQEEIEFALSQEPADAEDKAENEVWEQLHIISGLIEDVIKEYKQREKVYKVGQYYLNENNGSYLKCTKRTNKSVWFNGYERFGYGRSEIIGNKKEERTRGTYNTNA